MNKSPSLYKKHNSFFDIRERAGVTADSVTARLRELKSNHDISAKLSAHEKKIYDLALDDILNPADSANKTPKLKLSPLVVMEINSYKDDTDIARYLVHRYRYEIYPQKKVLDDYPPYLQLEPSSVCNFRCVFCYQVDKSFSRKSEGHMGYMNLGLFKDAIDQVEGHIEFMSLASRGEPTLCPDFDAMMAYTTGKFLNLKINTNASLLTEKRCHAILQGGVRTVVISADAAEEPLYSQLRVNGKLNQVIENVTRFNDIRNRHYSDSEIITRVSGVKLEDAQDLDDMEDTWGELVDQVAFVQYNPSHGHENAYYQPTNDIEKPCSDLWRRMYIWQDGRANPCEVDYKSLLSVGDFPRISIHDLWHSESYRRLRETHMANERKALSPCNACAVI